MQKQRNLHTQMEGDLQPNSKLKLNHILRRIRLSDRTLKHIKPLINFLLLQMKPLRINRFRGNRCKTEHENY